MTASADQIIARRRMRRSLTFWRVAAIAAVVAVVIAVLWPRTDFAIGPHVARVEIEGIILDDLDRERAIRALGDDDDVRAVIVRINSPGGTVAASEALYRALRHVAERKPVVSVMSEYGASGGYATAIAGDYVVAGGNTLTGSIGVVAEVPNIAGLMEMLGVEVTRIKSAPLKSEPTITEAPSPEALAAQETLILDMFDWFRDLVAERRGLSGPDLEAVSDGRAFTGRQALALSLIDALGGEGIARDWLSETRGVDRDTPVQDVEWRVRDVPWLLDRLSDAAAGLVGAERYFSPVPRLYAIMQ